LDERASGVRGVGAKGVVTIIGGGRGRPGRIGLSGYYVGEGLLGGRVGGGGGKGSVGGEGGAPDVVRSEGQRF
jgi:hypothetical protein